MKRLLLSCVFVLLWPFGLEAKVLLDDVPFISQSPPGDWSKNMNCGPASVVMLASYYENFQPSELETKDVLDWLYEKNYISPQPDAEYYDGNGTNMLTLVNILQGFYDFDQVVKKNINDLTYLKDSLTKGNPVIVAVHVMMNPNKMGHFMVVVGIDLEAGTIHVHDPGKTKGELNSYPIDQFITSWKDSNYASMVINNSPVTWHPDGTLLKAVGDNKVFVIDNAQKRWVLNEEIFNSFGFDWQKIITVTQAEMDCLNSGPDLDHLVHRELFEVNGFFYLMEKENENSDSCAVYLFSSELSLNSWTLPGQINSISPEVASSQYLDPCVDGGLLYIRPGSLVKPLFSSPDFGEGAVFVSLPAGELRAFLDWSTFVNMGYDLLPLTLVTKDQFYSIYQFIGDPISALDAAQCLSGSDQYLGSPELTIDGDQDGYTMKEDCDDTDPLVNPGQPESCNGIDDDCDNLVDEIEECQPEPEEPEPEDPVEPEDPEDPEEPVEPEEPEPAEIVQCTVTCPEKMNAYIWFGSSGEVSGPTAMMQTTQDEICLRGQPWIDFNCACTWPNEWSCFDPTVAEVECSHKFDLEVPGVIDFVGEGEIWFTEFSCF